MKKVLSAVGFHFGWYRGWYAAGASALAAAVAAALVTAGGAAAAPRVAPRAATVTAAPAAGAVPGSATVRRTTSRPAVVSLTGEAVTAAASTVPDQTVQPAVSTRRTVGVTTAAVSRDSAVSAPAPQTYVPDQGNTAASDPLVMIYVPAADAGPRNGAGAAGAYCFFESYVASVATVGGEIPGASVVASCPDTAPRYMACTLAVTVPVSGPATASVSAPSYPAVAPGITPGTPTCEFFAGDVGGQVSDSVVGGAGVLPAGTVVGEGGSSSSVMLTLGGGLGLAPGSYTYTDRLIVG